LGDYEVMEVLGQGGMGVVLKAFDPALHRPVAIKVLAAEYAANGAARKRFAREAQAAAAVSHDHVVAVYAVNAESSPPFLVMAFIAGQSLQERIDRNGPLEIKEVLRIGMQTAAGLAAAHAQGLVHRDIKPANIMLENGIERVRITDFGLARAVDDGTVTIKGAVAGTPQYMAPEQARGEPVDQRADLFSLGSTLYAMCTGRAPFRGDNTLAIIRQVCDVEPMSIRSINPDIPAWLEGIVRRLQCKEANQRLGTAAEVALLFEKCLAHVQQPDRQPLPALARELAGTVSLMSPLHTSQRRHRGRLVGGIVLLAILSSVTWFLWDFHGRDAGAPANVPVAGHNVEPINLEMLADFSPEDAQRLREQVVDLRKSISALVENDEQAGERLANEIGHGARRLSRELSAGGDEGSEPLEAKLATVRNRLRQLEDQIRGRDLESGLFP
jgi:serine/threonine protein kinase